MAFSAPAGWLNGLSLAYVLARLGHMVCYYANLKMWRSLFFGPSLMPLLGMIVLGVYSALQ